MNIKRIVVGPLQTNCYLLVKDNNCLVVDPGDDYNLIKEVIGSLNLLGVLITHRHYDHIGALGYLVDEYKVMVYDKAMGKGHHNIESFSFDIIENNGHSDDSITFYFKEDNVMFCGDFLFKGTIGRTDLPTGSDEEMLQSLKEIKKYPYDTIIYPGHGSASNLEYEFENNFCFKDI